MICHHPDPIFRVSLPLLALVWSARRVSPKRVHNPWTWQGHTQYSYKCKCSFNTVCLMTCSLNFMWTFSVLRGFWGPISLAGWEASAVRGCAQMWKIHWESPCTRSALGDEGTTVIFEVAWTRKVPIWDIWRFSMSSRFHERGWNTSWFSVLLWPNALKIYRALRWNRHFFVYLGTTSPKKEPLIGKRPLLSSAYSIATQIDKFRWKQHLKYRNIWSFFFCIKMDGAYSIATQHVLALKRQCLFQRNTLYLGTVRVQEEHLRERHSGHTHNTAGTFRRKFREKYQKDPRNALRTFPEIPLESTAGQPPQTLQFKAFGASNISRTFSPSVRLGTPLFSEVCPERATQSWSWNSQQYCGYFWTIMDPSTSREKWPNTSPTYGTLAQCSISLLEFSIGTCLVWADWARGFLSLALPKQWEAPLQSQRAGERERERERETKRQRDRGSQQSGLRIEREMDITLDLTQRLVIHSVLDL